MAHIQEVAKKQGLKTLIEDAEKGKINKVRLQLRGKTPTPETQTLEAMALLTQARIRWGYEHGNIVDDYEETAAILLAEAIFTRMHGKWNPPQLPPTTPPEA